MEAWHLWHTTTLAAWHLAGHAWQVALYTRAYILLYDV